MNITGSKSLSLQQVSKAATIINKEAGPGAHVFLGAVIDEKLSADELRVTVIATGIGERVETQRTAEDRPRSSRINTSFLQRTFKKRDILEVGGEAKLSGEPSMDVDYDTPAFLRRHSD